MRRYKIRCVQDNGSSLLYVIETWAWNLDDALWRCRDLGYLPLLRGCLVGVT